MFRRNRRQCHLHRHRRRQIERLRQGQIPIYEPGLDDLVSRNVAGGRLHFGTNLCEVLDDSDIVFCAVGTPPDEDGSAT